MNELEKMARALGGEVNTGGISCPGPGHSKQDRSLRVFIDPADRDGFRTNSFAGDGWRDCRDYVKQRLGIRDRPGCWPTAAQQATNNREKVRYFWSSRRPIVGTPAERYLREARGYRGPIPSTLAYLSPMKPGHHPALIAAYGIPDEPEPGVLAITDEAVMGVQLTLLKRDGSGKAQVQDPKLTIGRCPGIPIVLGTMNDLLGLVVVEGIEDGLSIHEATQLGVWVAGGAWRMPALAQMIPEYTDCITILTDRNMAGYENTYRLAERLRQRRLHVESVPI